MRSNTPRWPALVVTAFLAGCGGSGDDSAPTGQSPDSGSAPSNRIHVSPEIIANLGITFVEVRRARLATWLGVPGRLEVPEDRRWTVHAPASGRVTLTCRRWDAVEAGGVLGELVSPELLAAQRALIAAELAAGRSSPNLVAGRARLGESQQVVAGAEKAEAAARSLLDRLTRLSEGGGVLSTRELVEAQRQHAAAAAAVLDAALRRDELTRRVVTLESEVELAMLDFLQHLRALSVLTGESEAALLEQQGGKPRWKSATSIQLRAPGGGRIVDLHVASGERLDAGDPIAEVVDPAELVFRGQVPEGDLGSIPSGVRVLVEPASEGIEPIETRLADAIPLAHETTRTVRVEARVANPELVLPVGFSAIARVLLSESPHEENVVPSDCVVMDGLDAIVFVRDPNEPDELIRTPVSLGSRDRDSVEVLSGVLAGDQVVRHGALQLKEASSGAPAVDGHFHADGTFHGEQHK